MIIPAAGCLFFLTSNTLDLYYFPFWFRLSGITSQEDERLLKLALV